MTMAKFSLTPPINTTGGGPLNAFHLTGGWTDARIARISELWREGYSLAQIAREIGGGITRNAVLGKLHRLNLMGTSPNAAAKRLPGSTTRQFAKSVQKKSPVVIDFTNSATEPVPVGEWRAAHVKGQCDWIHGHPNSGEDWRRCGNPVAPERVYCGYHYAKTIQQPHRAGGLNREFIDANAQRQFQKVALG